jgi:1-acyl-sn-glycerol-3-phosphate acyltransferase
MTAAVLWLPASSCGPHCLPEPDAVPRVGPAAVLGRLTAVAAVLLVALLALPAIALSGPRGRARLTRGLARAVLAALGVRHRASGRVPQRGALLVANHVSWLDVLVLLAYAPVRLLAKREVRDWPAIGALATAMGTVFIDRTRPRSLPGTVADVTAALADGGVVAVFPEGTTWCGRTGGTFRPAMFQAAVDAQAPVVPVALRFELADGTGTTIAAFLGDDTLWASVRRVVATRGLTVALRAQPALYPMAGASRRALARAAAATVHPDAEPSSRPMAVRLAA